MGTGGGRDDGEPGAVPIGPVGAIGAEALERLKQAADLLAGYSAVALALAGVLLRRRDA